MKKIKTWTRGILLLAFFTGATTEIIHGQIQIGTGPDSSILVIEAAEFGPPQVYQWNYTYNPLAPFSTADLIAAVDSAISGLNFTLLYGGTFLDAIEYSSLTLTNEFNPPYAPFWAQWVSGGKSGIPLESKPDGVWSAGFGITAREIAPGSWDGFRFNGAYDVEPPYDVISAPPSLSPIPEPSAVALLAAGGILLVTYARKRLHAC